MTQETLFPFESYQSSETTYNVDDGAGNVVRLPKYGSLTWIEDRAINAYYINGDGDGDDKDRWDKIPLIEAKAELSSRLLQLRFGTHPKDFKQKEEILLLPNGRPYPVTLVDAVYNFFVVDEAQNWKTDTIIPPSPEQAASANQPATDLTEIEKKKQTGE